MRIKLLIDRPAYNTVGSITVKAGTVVKWRGTNETGDIKFQTTSGFVGTVSHDDCKMED